MSSTETLVGSLDDVGAVDLLTMLATTKHTGLLRIESTSPHWAAMCDGELVVAGSAAGTGLVQAVVSAGLLDAGTIAAAGLNTGAHDLHLLPKLVDLLGAVKLYPLVREQTVTAVFQMLLPSHMQYAFAPGTPSPLAQHFRFPVDIVVLEATRRVEEWTEIAASIASTAIIFRPRRKLDPDLTTISLTAEEWSVLAVLDGRRSVAQAIAAAGRSSYEVCAVIHRLLKSGLVERLN
ncbi:MAG TPA: DUF4388 domain-containing protein [Microthrixaceae bacterium]|nr:DUF4388 domain-containing protein [Microthrixaceae bacterium]